MDMSGSYNPSMNLILCSHHWLYDFFSFLPLDEAIASRAVFVIVSGSDGRADGRTHLEPAK